MSSLRATVLAIAFASATLALPTASSQEVINPVPGLSDYWSDYRGTEPPYPGNETAPILPTTNGTAGPDDLLWQNLLAAEWIIFNFYQQAVETFNVSSFTDLSLPNTTYDRIQEVRDNEAGHLAIFQSQISSSSIKPGPCQYDFGYGTDVEAFLALIPFIEVSSITFLTGLVQQANLDNSKGALTAIAATECRHNTWALIDVQGTNPFGGPSDTVFPYANEILDATNVFTVPDSCPQANPVYPSPRQGLPQLSYNASTNSTLTPGSSVQLIFKDAVPEWKDASYYVVFYHGVLNITMPFDTKTNTTTIPEFEKNKGLIVGVISNAPGAPTMDSVVAGPVFLLEQPAGVIKELGE